jgi:lactoylglutathione lyase
MKISVQYTTMIVKSLTESVTFYRDVLGFSEGYHVDFPVGGITIMKSPQGACVELIEAPQFEVGLYSIGTDVDNLDETIEHLRNKGYETIGEIAKTTVGRQIFVKDPNGVRICLIEHTEEYKKKYMKKIN